MKNLIIIFVIILSTPVFGQVEKDTTDYTQFSSVNLDLNSILIISSATIHYESENMLESKKHNFKAAFGAGIWAASLFNATHGFLGSGKLIYIYGETAHHFEANLGVSVYFDQNQTTNNFEVTTTLPTLFIGYRYQQKGEKFMLKAGIGAIELIKLGIGYSF